MQKCERVSAKNREDGNLTHLAFPAETAPPPVTDSHGNGDGGGDLGLSPPHQLHVVAQFSG